MTPIRAIENYFIDRLRKSFNVRRISLIATHTHCGPGLAISDKDCLQELATILIRGSELEIIDFWVDDHLVVSLSHPDAFRIALKALRERATRARMLNARMVNAL